MKEQEYFPGCQEPENMQRCAEPRKSIEVIRQEDELFSYYVNLRVLLSTDKDMLRM